MDKAKVDTTHRVECDGADDVILPVHGMQAEKALVDMRPTTGKRCFGALKGKVGIGQEFFDPLPEDEMRAWE